MPSFSIKYEENIITITDRSFKAFLLNERELDIFEKNQMTMFFRPSVEKANRIKYTAPSSIPFDKYMQAGMNEHKLYSFIARITEVMSVVEKYDFWSSNLILDEKLIFIDELTDKIYVMYRPLNNRQAGGNVYGFLDNLIMKIKKYNGELADACDDLHLFLADATHYKISEIVEYLKRVYPSIYREIKIPEIDNKSTRLDTIIEQHENEGTICLTSATKTGVPEEVGVDSKPIIKLISKDKSTIIDVNKNEFIVGKSREKADGVITGNSMISRVHACFVYKDGKMYIKDLGSANGTFVDGNKLIDERPVLLNRNSIIRLADQDFTLEDCSGALIDGKSTKVVNIYDLEFSDRDVLISLEVAKNLSQEGSKVLFVSTDVLQSYGHFLGRNISLKSDVITTMKVDKGHVYHNSMNSIIHEGNLDMYPVFPGPLWAFNADIDLYLDLIDEVNNRRSYDYVVVDCRDFNSLINVSKKADVTVMLPGINKYAEYMCEIVQDNISNKIRVVKDSENEEVVKEICRTL